MKKQIQLFQTKLVCVLATLSLAVVASAAALPIAVKPGRISMPLHTGSVTGGLAGRELSIISIKEVPLNNGASQLVIAYGDHGGNPAKGEPGYFHVAIDRGAKRISLDLAQVTRTAVDQKDLWRALNHSKLVAASDITMDPQDSSTNITLNLRQAVDMKVKSDHGDQARIVIDLLPLRSGNP